MNPIFGFDQPWVLAGFIIFIPMLFFDYFSPLGKRERRLPPGPRRRLLASSIFFKICIAAFIAALAGPRWGTGDSSGEYRRGLDAVFAIDVSRSMEIEDAPGFSGGKGEISRLERGLTVARLTAAAVPGVRFASAVSRGRGLAAVPLTWDNEAIFAFLESLDGSSLTGRGTNLESLVDAARGVFQSSFPSRRLILLVSDGEALSGNLKAAVDRCAGEGVIVISLAVGSDEGRPLPLAATDDESGEQTGIISRRNSAVMRMAAERSGGFYVDGNREDAPSIIAAYMRSASPESGTRGGGKEKKQRWFLFLVIALAAYGGSKLSLLRLRNKRILSALAVLLLSGSCSRVSGRLLIMEANFLNSQGKYNEAVASYLKALEHEEVLPYAEYGLGSVYYSLDEEKAALERFAASQKILENQPPGMHRELRYRNYYNSGLALFGGGDFPGAAAAFREALRTDPARIEAKRNLELSLLSLEKEKSAVSRNEGGAEESLSRAVLSEYLRQKEQSQWKSRDWAPEEHITGPDY